MLTQTRPTKTNTKILETQIKQYQKNQAKVEQALIAAPLVEDNPELPNAILVDIDGTLAKRCNRGVFDFAKSIDDVCCEKVKRIVNQLWCSDGEYTIIIMTGREEVWRDITTQWLKKNNIQFSQMYMRRTGDRRASNIIKEENWAGYVRNKYNIFLAIDDRAQDIEMYRSKGIYVLVPDNSREIRPKNY